MGKSAIKFLFTSLHILNKEKDGRLQQQSQNMCKTREIPISRKMAKS